MYKSKVWKDFCRELSRHNLDDLGLKTGISSRTLYRWMQGDCVGSFEDVQMVAKEMGFIFLMFDSMEGDEW